MRNSKKFTDSFEKLLKANISQYLNFSQKDTPNLSESELKFLIGAASIFSLSNEDEEISLSYEICSRMIELFGDDNNLIIQSSDVILSRIGNFPGRTLLRSKFLNQKQPLAPFLLSMERLAREAENSLGDGGLLTDFQYKLYTSLGSEASLSVSAPTSAGKSYILNLDLVRKLEKDVNASIVYVVPTRALVTEVVSRVRTTLRQENIEDIAVRTAPFPVLNKEKYRGIVYILTQERLLRLLSLSEQGVQLTSLIIDEAHELQKGKRGILLQNAIDFAIKKFPQTTIFFASPLIGNPGYLLEVFKRTKNGKYFTEEVSPVSQNVILISEVPRKKTKVNTQLLVKDGFVELGQADLSFEFRGSKVQQKAKFSIEISSSDESVIIFADDAASAEECAKAIAAELPQVINTDEIRDFVSFIKSDIHAEYPLIECLKNGVAFHYGNMPSIVRSGVERMFKEGKIRYLCSTSTLLQGVNLPAKHIVIENPHLGNDPMGRADFRNLAGRAGRLLKEFHGNVWCLRPGDWDDESYKGANLQEIKSAMDNVMEDGGSLIGGVADGLDAKENEELADAAFSRLYYEVTEGGAASTFSSYENERNAEILQANIQHMETLKIELPISILEAHRSLRPDLLQNLYDILFREELIQNAILINPHETGGKARMDFAMAKINKAFGIDVADRYFNWISTTAHRWVWGTPIGEMLSERVAFVRRSKPDSPASPEIRALLKLIETEVRYKLVKYFAAYEDILKLVLAERGFGTEITVAPYHIYLEFGSSDPITLSLMALGLSRFTAIKLKNTLNWAIEQEPEDYLAKIASIQIRNLPLPTLCKQELYELLGES
jgi:superfamily II DNA/RNA helicase